MIRETVRQAINAQITKEFYSAYRAVADYPLAP